MLCPMKFAAARILPIGEQQTGIASCERASCAWWIEISRGVDCCAIVYSTRVSAFIADMIEEPKR